MTQHQIEVNNQYPGGKGGAGVYQRIINQMRPHSAYIEGFVGSGAVLRKKKPAKINIAFDKDPDAIEKLPECEYPQMLQLKNKCFIAWLGDHIAERVYDGHLTTIYLDPPYLMETRKTKRNLYKYEMTYKEHEQLLKLIIQLNCDVIISGYWSGLYEAYLANWRTVSYMAQTRSGKPALEHLWMNYPEPTELHDYAYLGEDAQDRQRIRRKIARWKARLAGLPPLESAAILQHFKPE